MRNAGYKEDKNQLTNKRLYNSIGVLADTWQNVFLVIKAYAREKITIMCSFIRMVLLIQRFKYYILNAGSNF